MKLTQLLSGAASGAVILSLCASGATASSHREAPNITELPKVDNTDVYFFRSYEPGREDFVTVVSNFIPLQDSYGGPNYFTFDEAALYEIHFDNDGDAVEDLTFQFRFDNESRGISVDAGGVDQELAIIQGVGTVGEGGDIADTDTLGVLETYEITLVEGDRRRGRSSAVTRTDGSRTFIKPLDYIGTRTLPDYNAYANGHIFDIDVPGCSTPGRVFVGQRREVFFVNLGQVFDLLNTGSIDPDGTGNRFGPGAGGTAPVAFPPVSAPVTASEANANVGQNVIDDSNTTSIIMELPIDCLTNGDDPVIGTWSTASLPRARILLSDRLIARRENPDIQAGRFVQVSRLGSPLVNELVIGLNDKDTFNASEPVDDPQFLSYVVNPSFPEVVEQLFGPSGSALQVPDIQAPNVFPRDDLVAIFLTGANVPGVLTNQSATFSAPGEMLRLDTSILPLPLDQQNQLGVLGGDAGGYPNGRRPADDVVDIVTRTAMGAVLGALGTDPALIPAAGIEFTDGSRVPATDSTYFLPAFPYLAMPLAGDQTL